MSQPGQHFCPAILDAVAPLEVREETGGQGICPSCTRTTLISGWEPAPTLWAAGGAAAMTRHSVTAAISTARIVLTMRRINRVSHRPGVVRADPPGGFSAEDRIHGVPGNAPPRCRPDDNHGARKPSPRIAHRVRHQAGCGRCPAHRRAVAGQVDEAHRGGPRGRALHLDLLRNRAHARWGPGRRRMRSRRVFSGAGWPRSGGPGPALPPGFSRVADLKVRYLSYGELKAHSGSTVKFGHGMKPIRANARELAWT